MDEATAGLIRHALTFGGGMLAAHGKLDPGSVEAISGIITTAIGVGWSLWVKRKKRQ